MISVSENPIVQSHPVRWHGGDSTAWTGLSRFSHWLLYASPVQFPPPVLFPVPFRIFHIIREPHFLYLLPLFLRFLCIPRKKKLIFSGKSIKNIRAGEKKIVPEDRQERRTGRGVWSRTLGFWWFPWNWRAMARNRAVLEQTMAVAITTVPLEQLNI